MTLMWAISVLSAAAIAYEILLTRLFSLILWHHFAYMIISLALLGYGASGTFIALTRERLLARFHRVFATAAVLFGVTAVGGFALAQRIAFNPLEVVWDPWQQVYLLELYVLLAVPFFCAATCVGLAFARSTPGINRVYRSDLLGAGTGALGIVLMLFALPPADCLRLIGCAGFIAAGLAAVHGATHRWPAAALIAAGVASVWLWPSAMLTPRLSPYKELSQTLQFPGAHVLETLSSPLGVLTVVDSIHPPIRHAPGLSLNASGSLPAQLAVFTDGGGMTAITRFDGRREPLAYLDFQVSALPYHLLRQPHVLVLGGGGGADVLQALYHGVETVDVVELNPQMVSLLRGHYAGFAGHLYDQPEVRVHVAEARGFVTRSGGRFDLIQMAMLDAFAASSAGHYALTESTLYTVEALKALLSRLTPGGMLAVTRWLLLPPRDSLKLFATAVAALKDLGVADPGERLVMVRSWNTVTLLVKNGPFTPAEMDTVRSFSLRRGFDPAWYPGLTRAGTNRINVLRRPYLYEGAVALLGPHADAFRKNYKFQIAPATDDRPYFFHFFKWKTLPELLALRGAGGIQFLEWGYVVLVATLLQAVLISLLLVLVPLGMLRRAPHGAGTGRPFGRVVVYFLALGFAFMFVEMAFIQRFTLFLSHPLYAITTVLCAFLVFAGLGSGFSAVLTGRLTRPRGGGRSRSPIAVAVTGVITVALLYLAALPWLLDWMMAWPQAARMGVTLVLIAPLAFCMGMPFPLGLTRVSSRWPELVPWAWGINGCASVTGAVLATLLAVHFGFMVVVALAAALYALAAVAFRGETPGSQ